MRWSILEIGSIFYEYFVYFFAAYYVGDQLEPNLAINLNVCKVMYMLATGSVWI